MQNKQFTLRYLPLFQQDLLKTALYITDVLGNPDAAEKLIDDVEKSILERLKYPTSFEPFHSCRKRKQVYYRILIRNYSVFYVVIDDVMEVRRFLYNQRNIDNIL